MKRNVGPFKRAVGHAVLALVALLVLAFPAFG